MNVYKFGEDEVLIRDDDKVILRLTDNTYVMIVEHTAEGDSFLDLVQFSPSGEKLQTIYMNGKPRRTDDTQERPGTTEVH